MAVAAINGFYLKTGVEVHSPDQAKFTAKQLGCNVPATMLS
jgi:hypothetical protein